MDENSLIAFSMEELLQQNIATTNLYLKLSDSKYVVIAKAGTNLSTEYLNRLRERGVNTLFVRAEEYNSVIVSSLTLASQVTRRAETALSPKISLLRTVSEGLFFEIRKNGITREGYGRVKAHCENIMAVAQRHTSLKELIKEMGGKEPGIHDHALEVTLVSLWIAAALEWTNPVVLERLAIAGFLHDVGLLGAPAEISKKPRDLYSPEEKEIYRQHPEKGRDMLLGHDFVMEEVPMIIYQHHENAVGTGFPLKPKDAAVHPLSRVVALASEFCHWTFPAIDKTPQRSPEDAYTYIEIGLGNPYNKTAMQALQRLIQNNSVKKSA